MTNRDWCRFLRMRPEPRHLKSVPTGAVIPTSSSMAGGMNLTSPIQNGNSPRITSFAVD